MSEVEVGDLQAELEKAEENLVKAKERLAELRRRQPRQEVTDYTFKGWDGSQVTLSSLFGDKKDLILIQNMGKGCPNCTMWADGFNGVLHHLEHRAAFAVISPDDSETQKKFATGRGWRFKMCSGQGSSFAKNMGFQSDKGGYNPGVLTFRKESDGKMYRISQAGFGPGDDFCTVWHLFDLLKDGPAGWEPKYSY